MVVAGGVAGPVKTWRKTGVVRAVPARDGNVVAGGGRKISLGRRQKNTNDDAHDGTDNDTGPAGQAFSLIGRIVTRYEEWGGQRDLILEPAAGLEHFDIPGLRNVAFQNSLNDASGVGIFVRIREERRTDQNF